MNKDAEIPLLLDLYGAVLSDFQKNCLDYYYNSDFSLSEIADNVGKTRQGVFDSIKRAEKLLRDAESKLKFLEKIYIMKKDFLSIKRLVNCVRRKNSDCESVFRFDDVLEEVIAIVNKYDSE